jgi:hypothetical protein
VEVVEKYRRGIETHQCAGTLQTPPQSSQLGDFVEIYGFVVKLTIVVS